MDEIMLQVPFDDGYIGCECPHPDCRGYFKEQLGTGVEDNTQCHCPYCGYAAPGDEFLASDTQEYLTSVAANHVFGLLLDKLKESEFDYRPIGAFGVGLSLKIEGTPPPI